MVTATQIHQGKIRQYESYKRRYSWLLICISGTDDAQDKVIKVVPDDLLSPSSEVAPQDKNAEQTQSDGSRSIE